MQIDYVLRNDEKGTLKIYDLTGQLISIYSLLPEKNILQIEDITLDNGVYLYEIGVNDKILIKEKLIIIR